MYNIHSAYDVMTGRIEHQELLKEKRHERKKYMREIKTKEIKHYKNHI